MRFIAVAAVVAACTGAAGCGGEDVEPIPAQNAPAVTAPNTEIPYEAGGADGSGSDGERKREERGGVAAGKDSGSGG